MQFPVALLHNKGGGFTVTTPQEVNRLTDVHHTTRIDGIAAALHALGKRLDLRAV